MAQSDTEAGSNLPSSWLRTTVGEIYKVVGGGTPSTKVGEYWQGDIAWISSADIYGPKDIRPRRAITEQAIQDSATNLVPPGSLIVVTRVGLGKVALTDVPLCFSQDSQALIGNRDLVDPDYAIYYLSAAVQEFKHRSRGTTISGVTKKQLLELSFVLSPLTEQHRIVAEIETQFTRLEAGVAALKRAQANLRRYKASVLKAACEGRLVPTEAELARAEGRGYEPADVLLDRILAERRAKWEAENPGKKYKEPKPPDTSGLPELPEGWAWASTEAASQRIVDCLHSTPNFQESGFACVDSNCIKPGKIVHDRLRYVDEATFAQRNRRMKPMENDVLFSREGALLGVAVRVPANLDICLGQRMMVFRLDAGIEAQYFETVLNSPVFRAQYVEHITGTASPHLNIRDIRLLGIPVPPISEQHRIVTEVERRLSVVGELEKQVEAALRRAERLRQAILKHAFEGKLVPQDPNDEPAPALLARIKAERSGQGKKAEQLALL